MSNIYDRIFKENIEPLIEAFAENFLGLNLDRTEELKDKIQKTWEREGDFLKKLTYDDPQKNCVLHIEFHVKDEDIRAWMLLTYGMIHHQFSLPVKQYVIYVGRKKRPSMPFKTEHENCSHRFHVINMREFSYKMFLESDIPELVVLAILSDFEGEASEKIIRTIFKKLQELKGNDHDFDKYIQQLEVLSRLRNLQPIIVKTISAMPFIYDLKGDIRYKQGREATQKEFVEKLIIQAVLTDEQIADIADVSLHFVKQIRKKLTQPIVAEEKELATKTPKKKVVKKAGTNGATKKKNGTSPTKKPAPKKDENQK